ncbi:MAG: lysylphosphatidylglycerol synthase transmembrane domain-containing protein [Rhodospirillales bacterium]
MFNKPTTRQIGIFLLKLCIAAALIYMVSLRVDGRLFLEILSGLDPWYFAAALFLMGIQIAVHIRLWSLVLWVNGIDLPPRRSAMILLFSLFLNQGLPSALGGVGGRVYFTWRAGVPFGDSMSAALTERLVFIVSLIAICMVTLPYLHSLSGNSEIKAYSVFLICAAAAIPILLLVAKGARRIVRWEPLQLRLRAAAAACLRMMTRPFVAWRTLGLIMVYHGLSLAALWVLTVAVSTPISPLSSFVLTPHVLLLAALPITINGWGVREVAMSAFLGIVGVSIESAIAVSVLFGIAVLFTRMPLGLIWFLPGDWQATSAHSNDEK